MPTCGPCSHRNRDEIDVQLINGVSFRRIAACFNLSLGSISRHKAHVKEIIRERTQDQRADHGDDLLQRVQRLTDEAIGILEIAKAEKNLKAATSAICAAVRTLELCGRLDGSLAQPHAPGLHLTLNRVTNNTIVSYDSDDRELAELVSEATRNFDPAEIERLRQLVCTDRAAPALIG